MTKKSSAKKTEKKAPTVENPGVDLPPEVTGTPAENRSRIERQHEKEAADLFTMFRRELGASGFVTLSRSHAPTGQFKPAYIGQLPADQFTMENVANIFGGGDFIARGRGAGGTFNEERRFTIDPTIPPKNPQGAAAEKKEASPALDIAAIVTAVSAAMPRPEPPRNEGGLIDIVKAALARPEPKGETEAMMAMVKQMQEDARKAEDRMMKMFERLNERAPVEQPKSLREQLEEARDLMEMMGGGGKEKSEPFWKDLGKGLAENLGPLLLKHFAGGAPAMLSPALAAPGNATVTAPPVSPVNVTNTAETTAEPVTDMNPMLTIALKQFRTAAFEAAKNGGDAYEFVSGIMAMVPANMLGSVFNTANAEDWFSRIFAGDTEALKHTGFLNEVRNSILARALIAHVTRYAGENKPAKQAVADFIAWVSPDFADAMYNMADKETWPQYFQGVKIHPAWLTEVATTIEKALDGDEDGEGKKVVPMNPKNAAEKAKS